MCVATELSLQARCGRRGEVGGHDGGGSPEVSEGRARHPGMADRHELRNPHRGLPLEDGDGLLATPFFLPGCVELVRHLTRELLTARDALSNRHLREVLS